MKLLTDPVDRADYDKLKEENTRLREALLEMRDYCINGAGYRGMRLEDIDEICRIYNTISASYPDREEL